jgi:hypothetical protein
MASICFVAGLLAGSLVYSSNRNEKESRPTGQGAYIIRNVCEEKSTGVTVLLQHPLITNQLIISIISSS